MLRIALLCILGPIILLSTQAAIFICLFYFKSVYKPADAVIVFGGSLLRIRKGASVAKDNGVPVLIVSPAAEGQLQGYRRSFSIPAAIQTIIEPQARTTYENAYFCADIIRQNKFGSVVLVTSDYHMPRAYILLRIMTLGQKVKIQRSPLESRASGEGHSIELRGRKRLLYNEMIKFWGSLYELGYHLFTRKFASQEVRKSKGFEILEKIFLID